MKNFVKYFEKNYIKFRIILKFYEGNFMKQFYEAILWSELNYLKIKDELICTNIKYKYLFWRIWKLKLFLKTIFALNRIFDTSFRKLLKFWIKL